MNRFPVHKAAVPGAGVMGAQIAARPVDCGARRSRPQPSTTAATASEPTTKETRA